jgi:hypothetical protein
MTILFSEEDYRQLENGETYEDKFVVLTPKFLNEEYRTAEFQLFKAKSGFGCHPDKMGAKIFGYFVADKEAASTRREYVLGVATDDGIARWEQLYGKKAE